MIRCAHGLHFGAPTLSPTVVLFLTTHVRELSPHKHCWISPVRSGRSAARSDESLESHKNGYLSSVKRIYADFTGSGWSSTSHESSRERIQRLRSTPNSAILSHRLDLWENDHHLAHLGPRALLCGTSRHVPTPGPHWQSISLSLSPSTAQSTGYETYPCRGSRRFSGQPVVSNEFEWPGARYWNRVLRYGQRVQEVVTSGGHVEVIGRDKCWETNTIIIAGNHYVGYARDITKERLQSFERLFGKAD